MIKTHPGLLPLLPEFVELRHHFHANPELGFEEFETAKLAKEKLRSWGWNVSEKDYGITGFVATMKKGSSSKVIGFRADMDALPMSEATGLPYASKTPGKMHACGHDGHTATLLLAAKYWASAEFDGQINLYFQPAEEKGAGSLAMVKDGCLKDYPCDYLFGNHNMPMMFPPSDKKLYIRAGGVMASSDAFKVTLTGKGGHSSAPHMASDPTIALALCLLNLQTILSRRIDPQNPAVVSCGGIQCGNDQSYNIIAQDLYFLLHIRSLYPETRKEVCDLVREICTSTAKAAGCEASYDYIPACPVTFNDPEATQMAMDAARVIANEEEIETEFKPFMGSEDFGNFGAHGLGEIENPPKICYIFTSNGGKTYVHHPEYDFNDELLGWAASYFLALAQNYLK